MVEGVHPVKTAQDQPARAILRRLPLFAVFVGLVLMHTLGHSTHDGHAPTPASLSAQASSAESSSAHMAHGRLPVVVGAASSAAPTMEANGVGGGMPDPLTVCLAILASAAALLLARSSRRAVLTTAGARASLRDRALVGSRSPPFTGFSLTSAMVLRM